MKQHFVLNPRFSSGDFKVSAVHLCLYSFLLNYIICNNHYMRAGHGMKTFGSIFIIDKMIKITFGL